MRDISHLSIDELRKGVVKAVSAIVSTDVFPQYPNDWDGDQNADHPIEVVEEAWLDWVFGKDALNGDSGKGLSTDYPKDSIIHKEKNGAKTISIPDALYNKATALAKEYMTQDNMATAYPIFFTVRDVIWVDAANGSEERVRWYDHGMADFYEDDEALIAEMTSDMSGEEKEKTEKDIREYLKYGDHDMVETYARLNGMEISPSYEKKAYKKDNMFLTDKACWDHIRQNAHHYSDKVHPYCNHAWRNPEMEVVYELLKEIYQAGYLPIEADGKGEPDDQIKQD